MRRWCRAFSDSFNICIYSKSFFCCCLVFRVNFTALNLGLLWTCLPITFFSCSLSISNKALTFVCFQHYICFFLNLEFILTTLDSPSHKISLIRWTQFAFSLIYSYISYTYRDIFYSFNCYVKNMIYWILLIKYTDGKLIVFDDVNMLWLSHFKNVPKLFLNLFDVLWF